MRWGLAAAVCISAAWAVDWKALQPQGYVSDFAGVVDPGGKAQLEAYCATVGARHRGADGAGDRPLARRRAHRRRRQHAFFAPGAWAGRAANEGILLLLAVGDRRSRLEVGYGLEPILPDGLDGSILRAMRPALRQGDYGDAMRAAASTIGDTIASAKHVTLNASLPRRVQPSAGDSIPWPLIFGGVFVLLWLMRAAGGPRGYGGGGGGFLPGLILGGMMGRSTWGSRGSGGFGGFDSGDGFGGFGGGDSGGGGASSDW